MFYGGGRDSLLKKRHAHPCCPRQFPWEQDNKTHRLLHHCGPSHVLCTPWLHVRDQLDLRLDRAEGDVRMGQETLRDPDSAVGLQLDSAFLHSTDCKCVLYLFLSHNTYLPKASLGLDPTNAQVVLRYSLYLRRKDRFRAGRGWEPLHGSMGLMNNPESLPHSELGRGPSIHVLLVAWDGGFRSESSVNGSSGTGLHRGPSGD